MWLILQNDVSEAVSTKTTVFHRCIKLSGWFYYIGILYSGIRVGTNLKNCRNTLVKCQIFQTVFFAARCRPCKTVHHLLSSFFFSKPSAKIANVGKLLWAQTSYKVFVWVQVYFWLPEKCCCLRVFIDIEDLCRLYCRMPSYIAPPFPVIIVGSHIWLPTIITPQSLVTRHGWLPSISWLHVGMDDTPVTGD